MKPRSSITSVLVVQTFWNFLWSMASIFCHALSKFWKRLANRGIGIGQTRFHGIWIQYTFRKHILYCPLATYTFMTIINYNHEFHFELPHYTNVIMGTIASQITSLTIVYSAVYSGADQRRHQSSASLAFVRRIHRGPVNSPHKWPVTRKMFPFDDVIMLWWYALFTIDNSKINKSKECSIGLV